MKLFNKIALSASVVLFSGAVFATSCPSVGGYTLKSHDANNAHCTYHSNKTVKLVLGPPAATKCPRFTLTDPHFQVEHCNHNVLLTKCVCVIQSH